MSSPWIKGYKGVAEYFNTNKDTVKHWHHNSGLPGHRRGKWIYFHRNEIDKWMLQNEGVTA